MPKNAFKARVRPNQIRFAQFLGVAKLWMTAAAREDAQVVTSQRISKEWPCTADIGDDQ
jgi:hypothetical protein